MKYLLAALCLCAVACRSAPPIPGLSPQLTAAREEPEVRIVVSIADSLSRGQSDTLFVGERLSLAAGVIRDSMYLSCAPAWRSLHSAVATVDSLGRLRGLAPGTATISVACGAATGAFTAQVRARP